jgi:hypothetical protein
MEELSPPHTALPARDHRELLYFWALGDLHYCAIGAWHAVHTQRLLPLFRDLRQLWTQEGEPVFCVSPGDIIDSSLPENYQLAKSELAARLCNIPFYPGLGNLELFPESTENLAELVADFTTFWERPPRYYWTEGQVLCVMLDVVGYGRPILAEETLAFLETALAKHPRHPAVIFAHCPLYGTVGDRDPARNLDYDSLEPFFYLENSAEVRAVLGRHPNACLYLSGHTHSGWPAPNLDYTERLVDPPGHPVTHINLMSPWYTGTHKGGSLSEDLATCEYREDDPDVLVSFAIRVYRTHAIIRLRDHRARTWLAEWTVPTQST